MSGIGANTVLIVDDHPAVCDALSRAMVTESSLQVVGESHTGNEALQQIRELQPDLVIVDLKLPDMDGLNLIARMRQSAMTNKVLVFSMLDPRVYVSRIREAGGNGFISKDKPVAEVVFAARQILHGYSCFPDVDDYAVGRNADADPLKRLSQRELGVMLALARGLSNKELAGTLHLSEKTIASHKAHILDKLNLKNIAEMIEFARTRNLLD